MAGKIRLDKYLSEMNEGSRTQIKEMAKGGAVRVNGDVCKKTDLKIDPDTDRVTVDGRLVSYLKYEYYMLNKPKDVVSATQDNLHKTVIELLPDTKRKDLFPVGRLDIDTEGLLLITNDGELAHQLLSPKKHVDKVYYAEVAGTLPEDAVLLFQNGFLLPDGTKVLPANLEILSETEEGATVRLTIHEGKFHQVKRMFEAAGCRVTYLKRLSMGPLQLDPVLQPGEYRTLGKDEIKQLKER